jgi:hypothetical protein
VAIIQIDAQGHPTGLSDVLHCFCATGDPEHAQPRTERVQKPQTDIAAPEQHDARAPESARQSPLSGTRTQGLRPQRRWHASGVHAARAHGRSDLAPGCAAA